MNQSNLPIAHSALEPSCVYSNDRFTRAVTAAELYLHNRRSNDAVSLAAFDAAWKDMEYIAPYIMLRTLSELECFHPFPASFSVEHIMKAGGIPDRRKTLLVQWLDVLASQGFLNGGAINGTYWREELSGTYRCQQTEEVLLALKMDPPYSAFAEYFRECARHQTALLKGRIKPNEVLFPRGREDIANALYRTNPASHLQNHIGAISLKALIDDRSSFEKISILEVGGGIGATTSTMITHLPKRRIRYCFTDISRFFIKRAKRRFSDSPFITYNLFDIDKKPSEQGFAARSFDIIIAANVLHAARHLGRTLEHLVTLLRPKGLLMVIEGTSNTPVQMLTVGHFDAFGHYEDWRTKNNRPFLSATEWRRCLLDAGFQRVAPIPRGAAATHGWSQHVLLAET